ncbi:unnamed protein product [Brassicogethes aeneus]|uniref:Uncharacterized protein n=1 Tax=Brassicogethes aeneus TaxID=1431903 RepID=A0A9P0FKL2_BRAAE|nr:unnamed protein product [Brassicogethes aeneus]
MTFTRPRLFSEMSENFPEPSTSAKEPSKRKHEKAKLPTPPPDPTGNNDPENIAEYIDSLKRSTATYASLVATEQAFDHYLNLFQLIGQMLNIKEQNAKLHRRIRDLEQMNNLTKLHKQLEHGIHKDCPELDKDTAFAESILEDILLEIRKEQEQNKHQRSRPSLLSRQRNRSGSATDKSMMNLDPERQSKVSKWTKVKAAFKWEKASTNIEESKPQEGDLTPVNKELACYLRVPSTSGEDTGHSPVDSVLAEMSTPGSLSTASSNEDFNKMGHSESFKSSEDEHSQNYIPQSKDYPSHSKTHSKFHRTPWAKMKDIIQTRNSFKKKHRLSAQSDDIQIDVELCSDTEDVFIDDSNSKSLQSTTPSPRMNVYRRCNSSEIPSEIIARYHQVLADEEMTNGTDDGKISKWIRVKKAFLSPEIRNRVRTISEKEFLEAAEKEIQKNYKALQNKISKEFYEKRNGWERMKQCSPSTSTAMSSSTLEDYNDPVFVKKMEEWKTIKSNLHKGAQKPQTQMARETDLPPEFKKKLQEWERIKKLSGKESSGQKKKIGEVPRWKSLSGPRSETTFELPPLSDDFKKKLEEWRHIKATGGMLSSEAFNKKLKDKTPSPKLSRKNSSHKHRRKSKDPSNEIHYFEKECCKTEKDKYQRIPKSRKISPNKKEVLVHTPSGFYRFEGISRKFTQKLYEWEKAQGIGPESSTVALLTSLNNNKIYGKRSTSNSPSLVRSKSVDSIAKCANILTCPTITQQPSSLSLNDVNEFDQKSLVESKYSSMNYLNYPDDDADEPEALIVEVEDYVEETASPLKTFIKEQKPVYQREKMKAMCEGETIAAPKVRRSESKRAQANYNIMEEIFIILRNLLEHENELMATKEDYNYLEHNLNCFKIKDIVDKERLLSRRMIERIIRLQEANVMVISSINKDEPTLSTSKLYDVLEAVQDLSSEILQITEHFDRDVNERTQSGNYKMFYINSLADSLLEIRNKMIELRRHISYVCAATDLTTPNKKTSDMSKTKIYKTLSSESKSSRCETSENSRDNSFKKFKENRFQKSETCNIQSLGAVKKRIKYRQKSLQNKSFPDTDEEDDSMDGERKNKPKKICRTKSTPEIMGKNQDYDGFIMPDRNYFDAPATTSFTQSTNNNNVSAESPVTVFVKTTRKLFTPIGVTSLSLPSPEVKTDEIKDVSMTKPQGDTITHLPPLPSSPGPQRKLLKDVSPNIRLMLAKYNQKLSEHEVISNNSGGSSGSASPIAWRSPTAERRVKSQTEKYQEGLCKLSPLLGGRREVQKSASVGFIGNKQVTMHLRRDSEEKNLLQRSTSSITSSLVSEKSPEKPSTKMRKNLTLNLNIDREDNISRHSPEIRLKKLQKAKEEFLKTTPNSAPTQISNEEFLKYPIRNRLSQISVDSESSYDSTYPGALIKSVSAGMINIDPDAYKQFDPEYHASGYVSLPRSGKKTKEGILGGKFAFSNIASKFRKVRMRKGKDKMNAVSTLCRQSLVVDISPSDEVSRLVPSTEASSTDVSPSSSRSGSWIKKPKLFRR